MYKTTDGTRGAILAFETMLVKTKYQLRDRPVRLHLYHAQVYLQELQDTVHNQQLIGRSACSAKFRKQKKGSQIIEIIEISKEKIKRTQPDPDINTRISGIRDIIGAQCCYQLPCLIARGSTDHNRY